MSTLSRPLHRTLYCCGIAAAVLGLAACADSHKQSGTQVAATVNQGEVSVHQINLMLQQSRVRPEQSDAASRVILDRLIDQELMVHRAEELKLDREPRVMQMIDGARREVLARAYAEHTAESVGPIAAEEARKFYDSRPDLFSKRHVYTLHELLVQATPEQLGPLRERVKTAKSMTELSAFVKEQNLPARITQSTVAAEAIPEKLLAPLDKLNDGQAIVLPDPAGARLVVKVGSREAPLTFEQAQATIEATLMAERRRKAVDGDVKALREAAAVHKLGKFAEAASAPVAEAAAGSAPGSGQASAQAMPPAATSDVAAAPPATAVVTGNPTEVSAQAMDKGLAGLK